jgi:neural cell adhesion molecule
MPDTYYKLELRAHNAIGFSAPTFAYLKTARGGDLVGEIERIEDERFHLSSVSIILLAVLGLLLVLILVDLTCCITRDAGILALIFSRKAHSTTTRRFDRYA